MYIFLGLFLLPASATDFKEWFGTDDEGAAYDLNVVSYLPLSNRRLGSHSKIHL